MSHEPAGESSQHFNLALAFETIAGSVPDRKALVWGERHLTYAAMAERARRLASFLAEQGLGVRRERDRLAGHESGQDHVALALYNGNEYLESMLGCYRARVAPFNVNYRYVGEELRYLLSDAAPRGIVYHASLAPTLAAVLPDVPSIELLVCVDDDSGNPLLPGAVPFEEALRTSSPEGPPVDPSPDDLYILYTGGTTGMPKGVLWRQHDIFVAAMGGRRIATWELTTSYEALAARAAEGLGLKVGILPPFMHGAAQWATFMMLADGATIVLPSHPRRLDPRDVWQTVERDRVNTLTIVGDAMLRPLLAELDRNEYDTSSLVAIGNGGAPLTPAVREQALVRLPSLVISDSAGASETGAQMSTVVQGASGAGTFVPGPGTVVASEKLDELLAPGHAGIGWLAQTGNVPLGYLGDPEKTARTFPVIDGTRYAIPGDRARLWSDGSIELLGRDSVTVNSGGEKIFVEEVERALAGHPAVADVVVTGRPSERWGEEVVAIVQPATGAAVSAAELVTHAAGSIARYKLPKDVVFVPAVERSPSGKADYRWARDRAQKATSEAGE